MTEETRGKADSRLEEPERISWRRGNLSGTSNTMMGFPCAKGCGWHQEEWDEAAEVERRWAEMQPMLDTPPTMPLLPVKLTIVTLMGQPCALPWIHYTFARIKDNESPPHQGTLRERPPPSPSQWSRERFPPSSKTKKCSRQAVTVHLLWGWSRPWSAEQRRSLSALL